MPKEVDHPARRRELADAACAVIARNGLAATTLADIAEESGWSIGSIRHYFPNKDELIASALWRVGERIDDRIRDRTAGGMSLNDLRITAAELLPLDADRREMALVYLAFMAQAAVVPALAAAPGATRRAVRPCGAGGRAAGAPGRRARGRAPSGATRRAAPPARHHSPADVGQVGAGDTG
jgi:AcrR family transcriptional regulator